MSSHLIPIDIIDGLYDDFFGDFLDDRVKIIYDKIKLKILDKKEYIIQEHFEVIRQNTSVIKIYGKYWNKQVEASLNIDTQEILYNGKNYKSVSLAADEAKQNMTGKTDTSTNGWKWWRYDDNGTERFIDDFR